MPAAAPRGRANSATKNATITPGNRHRRHGATFAWPDGPPGEDARILVLLLGARRHAERECNGGRAGVQRPGRDHRGWLYSGARRALGRRAAATLAACIRACQA